MNLEVLENVPLAPYTTLKTGGVARYLAIVHSHEELVAAIAQAKMRELSYLIIGGGSNVLVSDNGYPGLVIVMRIEGRAYTPRNDSVIELRVGAGEELDAVVADTVAKGYWGLENLSSIPGTVGATPVQNVGAYGVEVKDVISKVEIYDVGAGEFRTLDPKECQFGYRDSIFKTEIGKSYIITTVFFQLSTTPAPKVSYRDLALHFGETSVVTPSAVREAVIRIRATKFPDWKVLGTAGSFFKNPILSREAARVLLHKYPELPVYDVSDREVKVSLGYVLDKICNLKGYRRGSVGLYEAQALVLVNYGGATAADILAFVDEVRMKVREATEIEIEPEVQFVGE